MDTDLSAIFLIWQDLTPWQRKKIVYKARMFVLKHKARVMWKNVKTALIQITRSRC